MKTQKPPRDLLKKSHADKSKKDYARDGSWKKEIDAGLPHMEIIDWDKLPDKAGETK